MSSIPCKFKNKCTNKRCQYSHELITRPTGTNPTLCKFGEECRTKNCTFTHLVPPKGASGARSDCKKDIQCTRVDCFFNHPNGRLIDSKITTFPEIAQQNGTALNRLPSRVTHTEHHHRRHRNQSAQSETSSRSSSQSSTTISERPCHPGTTFRREDWEFKHQFENDKNQSVTFTTNREYQPSSISEMTEAIETLLITAEEQQMEFDNIYNNDDDDDGYEQRLDALRQNASNELQSQRNEFQYAIRQLTACFHSLVSMVDHRSAALQLQQIKKKLERELRRWQARLPIYARRSEIIEKIRDNQVLILKADTGSGKSTQTVQYLCDEHFADHKQIICTQPRKLAARSLAARVAEEYGCKVGEEVGFQVGGGRSTTSNKTKIKFVTDTFFLNEYQNDQMLQTYSVVIVDEAHERKIDTDIVFGIMKLCLRKRRDLKLIVMSATLDIQLLYDYFSSGFSCGTLEVGGRTYPIEDTYLDEDVENYVQESVNKAVEIHQSGESGDILVFLTGQDEIDSALVELNQKLNRDESYIGLPLHGKLSEEENSRIFETMRNKRKIIFSTNVAETSVTIDGIKHVIESGMVKEKMWDDKRKMQVLKIGQITKSSVKQRRGRAGRTSAGKCYHLYTIETYEAMDACSRAEILSTQPTIAILKLKLLNITNIERFEWLEPPSASSLREARQTLYWLNALNSEDQLTDLGRNMARLDIDPKLTAMLYKAKELNCLSYALILAGMLTVSQNIWWNSKDPKVKETATQTRIDFSHESGDHLTLVNIYRQWNEFCATNRSKKEQYEWCRKHFVNGKSLQMAQEFIKDKARQVEHELNITHQFTDDLIHRLLQCMTAGYFLNLAVSNGPLRAGYQVISPFSSSTNETVIARVFRTSTLCLNESMPKYIIFNELLNLNETNYITILSSIDSCWLKSVSPQWYITINGANLHTLPFENYNFENIGIALLRAIVGKRNCHLNQLEEQTQSIIHVDYQQWKLVIWSRSTHLEKAKKMVREIIEKEKRKLLIEAEEIQIVGRTRILMGSGAISRMVLIEDEFIRIILTKLPTGMTEERIKKLCEPFGKIHVIDFIRQNENGSCVAVTYSTVQEARQAFLKLNGYTEQGRQIAVSGACLKTDATTGKQNCRLKAIWYLTPSTGNAKISFSQQSSALKALKLLQDLHYQCHYERSNDLPTLKVIYYLGVNSGRAFVNFASSEQAESAVRQMNNPQMVTLARQKQNSASSVLFQNFPEDFDEDDVREYFRSCLGLLDVQVLRGIKGQQFVKPANAEDAIRAIFNQYKSFQRGTVTCHPKIFNGRLEAFVEFLDRIELTQAINEMNGRTGLIGCGKVRLLERLPTKPKDEKITNKKRDDEHVVKMRHLDKSLDKYDLIRLLKAHQMYDDVKSVIVFRQKSEDKALTTTNTKALQEQETGLVALRSLFVRTKNLFRSEPDFQISSATPDGTVTALILFDDPVDVATAIQTYNNETIQLFQGASKLHLIPSMAYEIFINAALAKAIPEKIEQTIGRIRQKFKRVYIKGVTSKKTEKAANMKVFIDGDDIQQITMAKIEFDKLMKGTEYTFVENPDKTRLLLNRAGTTALQSIQNETGCYIWWNQSNAFVRIYGADAALYHAKKRLDEYIRTTLKNQQHTITLEIPPQVLKKGVMYQERFGQEYNVEVTMLVAQRKIRLVGKEDDVIKCEENLKTKWSKMSVELSPASKQITTTMAECPICCDVTNYRLQACGHPFCLDCLKLQLSTKFDTTLSNQTLEIKCIISECNQPFLLRDIKTIIDSTNMPKLARASFQAHLKTNPDLVLCMGLDCRQIYRKSKDPQSYFCESCLKLYCVKCEVEYHMGLTCEAYQAHLKWTKEERVTMDNIGSLNLKPCPSCKQVIDRYDGCNAVKCKCGISFCWLCAKTDPVDIHSHYNDRASTCFNKCFAAK